MFYVTKPQRTNGGGRDGRHINPLNVELYPICHLLALLGAHHIFHISRIRINPSVLASVHHVDL